MKNLLETRILPLIKYPGGKEKELNEILPRIPKTINRYFEPFIGGGAVFFSVKCDEYFINDKSSDLIQLYQMVKKQDDDFIGRLRDFDHNWTIMKSVIDNHSDELLEIYLNYKNNYISKISLFNQVSLFVDANEDEFNGMLQPNFNVCINNFVSELVKSISNKIIRMSKIENDKGNLSNEDRLKNIECSFKSAFYMHFRFIYNNSNELVKDNEISKGYASAIYVFIRQYCYSSMFRFNKQGAFNVPYGGISYNSKNLTKKVEQYVNDELVKHLDKTTIGNMDFHDFMKFYPAKKDDFIFLDPPYDTEFSTYDKNEFNKNDQKRLADYLINECKANFMVVIKNTDYISSLYINGTKTANGGTIRLKTFDKKYMVSFQDRNDKNAEHLVITNY